jgi:glycosyltransferase involved in cell wall biosynthesis
MRDDGRLSVVAELEGLVDTTAWRERHRAGLVADESPYGLHRLAEHGVDVWWRGGPPVGLRRRLDGRVARRAGGLTWSQTLLPRAHPPTAPDLVLCWDERSGVPSLLRERLLPRHLPVASGLIWATEPDADAADVRAATRWLPRAYLAWVLSTGQLEAARRLCGPRVRLEVLPFGVDVDTFTPAPGPAAPTDPSPLVVSVGNDRHRDHAGLVRAVSAVAGTGVDVRLELATRLPVDVPSVLGRRHAHLTTAELVSLYRRSAVVAVATRPNTHVAGVTAALEAMSCGRPVVVSRTPGMSDYVDDGRTGLLVEPGDDEAFARALTHLLADPDRAAAMGQAAAQRVRERHSSRTMAARLAELLRRA